METWMANPMLNANAKVARWHESKQVYGFKFLVTQILGYLTGGPQRYTGRPMAMAHKHLAITPQQWDHFMNDASSVFSELQIQPKTARDLRAILAGIRAQCILSPGEVEAPDPGLTKPPETMQGTLYYDLGGVYAIASFADGLVELVLRGDRLRVESHNLEDPAAVRHPPGLKFMVTELLCTGTGGPETATSRGFDDAKLGVDPRDWKNFMEVAAEAASAVWDSRPLLEALERTLIELKEELCVSLPDEADDLKEVEADDKATVCCGAGAFASVVSNMAKNAISPVVATGCPFASSSAKHDTLPEGHPNVPGLVMATPAVTDSLSRRPSFHDVPGIKLIASRQLDNPLQSKLDELLDEEADLCCPLTLTLFVEPVCASDKFLYEKTSLLSLMRSQVSSPMSGELLEPSFAPDKEKQAAAMEFRKARSQELVKFAMEASTSDPEMSTVCLERVGAYVQILKPENVPAIATEAREAWTAIGSSAPPELFNDAIRRKKGATSSQRQASPELTDRFLIDEPRLGMASSLSSSAGKASVKTPTRSTSSPEFQKRLDMLAATPDAAPAFAKKLFVKFGGHIEKLPEVLGLLEEQWGFPDQLFPMLWKHLRRILFKYRGEHVALASTTDGASQVVLEEKEWVDTFCAWIHGLRARTGQATVSRKAMVTTHNAVRPTETYFQGAKLGEGAFGEVFVMLHKSLGIERVMKVIKQDQAALSEEHVEEEVAVLSTLDHPNIVRIYDILITGDALHIVMDYAEGGDLAGLIKRAAEADKRPTEPWIRVATSQTCAALEYIHWKGVIHCDLKPANVMLLAAMDLDFSADPHILLVDFGLAEIFHDQGASAGGGKVKGTPLYLAPEGFEGHLTEKSDMWAVGVMLYEMLLGERPFQASGGNIFAYWMKIAKTEPSLEELPELARELVKLLLIKDPAQRPDAKTCRAHAWFSVEASSRPAQMKLKSIGHSNYFNRLAMFSIAAELSMKNVRGLFDVFKSIDSSGSGRLTQAQLGEGLKMLGIDKDPATMMTILDLDQNGYVSYTEFLAGALSTTENLSQKAVREAFDLFDLDGDGKIDKNELRLMLSGDGPLVDVLPDGHTIEEIMLEVGGEDGIAFADFQAYLSKSAKDDASAVQHSTLAALVEEGLGKTGQDAPPLHGGPGSSGENLPSAYPAVSAAVPAFHRMLSQSSGTLDEACLQELLSYPERPLSRSSQDKFAELRRHFLTAACAVSVLAAKEPASPQALYDQAAAEASKLESQLKNELDAAERAWNPPRKKPLH